jgi:hypothetical protein
VGRDPAAIDSGSHARLVPTAREDAARTFGSTLMDGRFLERL